MRQKAGIRRQPILVIFGLRADICIQDFANTKLDLCSQNADRSGKKKEKLISAIFLYSVTNVVYGDTSSTTQI